MCDGELSQLESLLQTVSPVLVLVLVQSQVLVLCWLPVVIIVSHNVVFPFKFFVIFSAYYCVIIHLTVVIVFHPFRTSVC